jgi:class 3 adenylate cyclase
VGVCERASFHFISDILYHAISFGVGLSIYSHGWRTVALPAHFVFFAVSLICFFVFPRRAKALSILTIGLDIALIASLNLACLLNRLGSPLRLESIASGDAMVVALGTFIILMKAEHSIGLMIRACAFILVGIPGLFLATSTPIVDVWLWTNPAFILCAAIFKMQMHRYEVNAARHEFRRINSFAPPAIVDQASFLGQSVEEIFAARVRFCVCICSDWRNYQSMTVSTPPEKVVESLEHYYNGCSEILHRAIPGGNYFYDWIADELFVVIFETEGLSQEDVVRESLNLAKEILDQRTFMAKKTGLPLAIDIGMAAGHASVGLMGPKGGLKATALGEVPGRARRLQSVSKTLRPVLGELDRLIVGEEIYHYNIRSDFKVISLTGERIKDLRDVEIYVLEATCQSDSQIVAA